MIQREEVVGDDGFGNEVTDWVNYAIRAASVIQQGGREFFAQAAIQSERRVVFRCRWVESVTPAYRVICDGVTYNIQEARRIGRKIALELHCTAGG
ncbi:MAG: phage head closure protein [Pseudolabrys sp.]|nr:phage head closure protein [Pseudolabrys sp.]